MLAALLTLAPVTATGAAARPVTSSYSRAPGRRRLRPGGDESCGAVGCLARRRYGLARPLGADRRARRRVVERDLRRHAPGLRAGVRGRQGRVVRRGCRPAAPERTADPLEGLQWDMQQIRPPQAHDVEAGSPHGRRRHPRQRHRRPAPDFLVGGSGSNVDCARGRNFVPLGGPGVGNRSPARTTSSTARTSPARSPLRPTRSASSAWRRTSRSSR